MGEDPAGAARRPWFTASILATAGIVIVQSLAHLVTVLAAGHVGTVLDLDRSNGIPDLVSTIALAGAAGGAAAVAIRDDETGAGFSTILVVALAMLTVADLLHVGAHPASAGGKVVIALVGSAVLLLARVGRAASRRPRVLLLAAGCLLVCSFLVQGLDRYAVWFERARGDPVREYQIVAKEGFELLGWALVAVALWDEALRPWRESDRAVRARASRAPAPPRRRAA